MRAMIIKNLSNPILTSAFIACASVFFLAAALIAEHVFGLKPCILCLYQRIPYLITAIIGFLGLFFALKKLPRKTGFLLFFAALIFLGQMVLAFYHVGVEQHWWVSVFEACKADISGDDINALLKKIESAKSVPCDQIPWQLFGISMAGYNVLTAIAMSVISFLSGILILRKDSGLL
jgi:disulfide bond formation protein DsbB